MTTSTTTLARQALRRFQNRVLPDIHLSDAVLSDYMSGRLSERASSDVKEHLSRCLRCMLNVEAALDSVNDKIVVIDSVITFTYKSAIEGRSVALYGWTPPDKGVIELPVQWMDQIRYTSNRRNLPPPGEELKQNSEARCLVEVRRDNGSGKLRWIETSSPVHTPILLAVVERKTKGSRKKSLQVVAIPLTELQPSEIVVSLIAAGIERAEGEPSAYELQRWKDALVEGLNSIQNAAHFPFKPNLSNLTQKKNLFMTSITLSDYIRRTGLSLLENQPSSTLQIVSTSIDEFSGGRDPSHIERLYKYEEPMGIDSCNVCTSGDTKPFDLRPFLGVEDASFEALVDHPASRRLTVLNRIVQKMAEATGADWVGIYRTVPTSDQESGLVKEAYVGEISRAIFPLSEGMRSRSNNVLVGLTGKAVIFSDVAKYDGPYYQCDAKVKSELCVPLLAGDEIVGIIDAESFAVGHFTPAVVAEVVAVAVDLVKHGLLDPEWSPVAAV